MTLDLWQILALAIAVISAWLAARQVWYAQHPRGNNGSSTGVIGQVLTDVGKQRAELWRQMASEVAQHTAELAILHEHVQKCEDGLRLREAELIIVNGRLDDCLRLGPTTVGPAGPAGPQGEPGIMGPRGDVGRQGQRGEHG